MDYLHPFSVPATKSELEIFHVPPTQTVIDHTYEVEHRPTSTLDSTKTYDFNIPASEDFTDLSATVIYVKAKIVKEDGTNISTTIKPIKAFANALFEQVDFYLGPININQANNLYNYQSFIEELVYRHPNKADSGLMWDDETEIEKRTASSKSFDLYFRLQNSMCQQDKLLVNGVPITIRFTRSSDAFCLIRDATDTTTKPKIKIESFSLFIKRVKLFPDAMLGINAGLEKGTARYFITRNDVKSFSIPKGNGSVSVDNVYAGQLPKRMLIGFVSNKAFKGDLSSNPFNFQHFSITNMAIFVDGVQVPSIAYSPDFDNNLYMREFGSLYRYINQFEGVPQTVISHDDYKKLYPLFAFDLSPDGSLGAETGTLSLIKRGTIRVDVKFRSTLPETSEMIVFA
jgi:hypothetical protein